MNKPGRNEPCYCGSGKKYKSCHLREDQNAERDSRARVAATSYLQTALSEFAQDERFATEFAAALPYYWNNFYDISNADQMSEFEAHRFFDWFVYDYQPEDGSRLIEQYAATERDNLTSHQQAALDTLLSADSSTAFELTGYDGQILHLKEFMTGEAYDVFDAGGHGLAEVGDIILGRLIQAYEQLELSVSAGYIPADEIADLAETFDAAKTADAETYPDATHTEFMRRNNHLLVHHAMAQAEKVGRPAVSRLDPAQQKDISREHLAREKKDVHRPRSYGSTRARRAQIRRKAI